MPILDRFSLQGRRALVTGGGSGIGRSLALALAEAGADVAIADIDAQKAEDTAARIRALGRKALPVEVDVCQRAGVHEMVARVLAEWGRLDSAVNSAGIAIRSPVEHMAEADWDRVVDVDLKAVFLCCQAQGLAMLAQGAGSIVNIASISARIANRPQLHAQYNAAKAGVVQLTRSCAAEWAARGVRVNSISPGHTLTPMTAHAPQEMRATWLANTPMGRLGAPEDLQGAALFLASDASAYVTGHDLVVDGGYTLW